VVLDGELYTKDIPFEKLAGMIKKQKITNEDKAKLDLITYNVYDIVDLKAPFKQRIEYLREHFEADQYPRIKFVPTFLIQTVSDFRAMFSDFVQAGYEGIMLRNINGLYQTNYRSGDLMKYKEFDEDEYPITGFTEGEGREKGAVVWICETSDRKTFTVRPQGSIENRRNQFKNGASFVGKMMTVIHFGLTQEGIPRFPIGKAIREGY
jgi:DNA ligase-1